MRGIKDYDLDLCEVPVKSITFINCNCQVIGLRFCKRPKLENMVRSAISFIVPKFIGSRYLKLVNSRVWIDGVTVPDNNLNELRFIADDYSNIFQNGESF